MALAWTLARQFGISLVCLAAAHYTISALTPVVETYVQPEPRSVRVFPTYRYPEKEPFRLPPIPPSAEIEVPEAAPALHKLLEEAVYVP